MPFHVDYSIKRRTVGIRGASPVQFIICYEIGSIITLEATLNDYQNHRNVTFDWEQIEGNPVILSHPQELETTFEYTDNTDKIFRFYIDKDTARETHIDVRVYHTPLSFTGTGGTVHNHSGTEIATLVSKSASSKTEGYSREVVPTVEGVPAEKFTLEYVIEASLLTYADKLEMYYSPDYTVTPYILLNTWTADFPTEYVGAKGSFMLVLHVTFPSGIQEQYYSHLYTSFPKGGGDEIIHTVDDLFPIAFASKKQNIL